ncbi:MAG: hypothetical protein ACQESR_16880 [Planctomycetota bacterium]
MKDADGWCDNWELFVEELERRLQNAPTTEDVTLFFAGATVRWAGVIERIVCMSSHFDYNENLGCRGLTLDQAAGDQ